jgi:hypothetical protein
MTLEIYAGSATNLGALMEDALIARAAMGHPGGIESGVRSLGFESDAQDGRVFYEGKDVSFSDVLSSPVKANLTIAGRGVQEVELVPAPSRIREAVDGMFSMKSGGAAHPGLRMKTETPFKQ